jgi:LuxR family transcriptional regulator, quorum-sensing system regulator SdiA
VLQEHLTAITNSGSIEELWRLHTAKMAEYGFDRLLYGFSYFLTESSLGDPRDFVLLSNHAPEYIDGYIKERHLFYAPMLKWALDNEGACSWALLSEVMIKENLTTREKRVLEFNLSHSVTTGYSISFKSISPRAKGAIALTGHPGLTQTEVDSIWDAHGAHILLMNNIAHLKILNLPYRPSFRKTLTKRQRETLQWAADGKTMQDTAFLMGLTTATVEKHLRLARIAMNVDTTAQAVMKASMQNEIYTLDY